MHNKHYYCLIKEPQWKRKHKGDMGKVSDHCQRMWHTPKVRKRTLTLCVWILGDLVPFYEEGGMEFPS